MPPKIRNLDTTKMLVKQLRNLNIIKLDMVKQNYTEKFCKKNNIEFVKTIWLPLS